MTSSTGQMDLDILIHVSQSLLPTRCSAMAAGKETRSSLPLRLVDAGISREYSKGLKHQQAMLFTFHSFICFNYSLCLQCKDE